MNCGFREGKKEHTGDELKIEKRKKLVIGTVLKQQPVAVLDGVVNCIERT